MATAYKADDVIRRTALDHLQAQVKGREDEFMLAADWGEAEINEAAIAEWAWGLLEAQREAMTRAVERALDD